MRMMVAEVANELFPETWSMLPDSVREEATVYVRTSARRYLSMIVEGIKDNVLEVMDLRHLVVSRAEANRALMVDLFLTVGRNEITFL